MSIVDWVLLAVVAAGVIIALFGWDRYRGSRKTAGKAAQPTGEVFTDPSTGKPVRVWYNPVTGEREYRPD
jgi:hypothetical protein